MQQGQIGYRFKRMDVARSFVQLSMDERRVIARMHEKKISQAEIARTLRETARPSAASCDRISGTTVRFPSPRATGT